MMKEGHSRQNGQHEQGSRGRELPHSCWYSIYYEARGERDEPKHVSRDQIMDDLYCKGKE